MKKTISFFLFVFFCFAEVSSQNLDSLYKVALEFKNDSVKISRLNWVGFNAIFSNTDLAKEVIENAERFAKDKKDQYGLAILSNTHGVYMDVTGQSDSAKYYFSKSLEISRRNNFEELISNATNNLGMYHWNKGEFNEALDYFFKSLKMDEESNDRKSMSSALNNIGLINQEMSLYEKAIDYHKRALEIRREFKDLRGEIASLNNIGICHRNLGNSKEAIDVYKKGVDLAKETNNLLDYYRLLDNLGNTYQDIEDYNNALKSYRAALAKPDNFEVDLKSEMISYSNIASVYNRLNKPRLALENANKGFLILKNNPNLKAASDELYLNSAESYYMLGQNKKARDNIKRFTQLKDSLFSEQNATAIADLEVKYGTEKKEKEILVQRAELAEQDLIIQKRNYQIYGLLGFALILGLIGYLFYNQQKLKNKQLQKENELKDALALIETQNKLQEQRLRISRELHDNIGAQLTFIISSLDNLKYAFDIKDNKLKNKLKTISEFTSNTIYELRDTIWAMNKDEISFEDLKTRIANYMDKAKMVSGDINFDFTIDSSVNQSKTFTSLEGINVHRIIQEAINNSLKYSDVKKISVDITNENQALTISIKDNGQGFDIASIEKGNGLINMEKRAKSIGAVFSIASEKSYGTEVKLII